MEPEVQISKPVFTTALNNAENIAEQGHVHLECRLEPINDPNLRVEWFVNGKAIQTGHRFRTTHDFGYVALDILYAYAEDSGTYMCKAVNRLGEAMNTCSVKVLGKIQHVKFNELNLLTITALLQHVRASFWTLSTPRAGKR